MERELSSSISGSQVRDVVHVSRPHACGGKVCGAHDSCAMAAALEWHVRARAARTHATTRSGGERARLKKSAQLDEQVNEALTAPRQQGRVDVRLAHEVVVPRHLGLERLEERPIELDLLQLERGQAPKQEQHHLLLQRRAAVLKEAE